MRTLYVIPQERIQNLDEELVKFAMMIAKRLGHEKLYLYISNPAYIKWYLERGSQVMETRSFRNHTVTILQFLLPDVED